MNKILLGLKLTANISFKLKKIPIRGLSAFSLAILFLAGIFLLPQFAFASSISADTLIELTNKERLNDGLEILTANQILAKAAYTKAYDIFTSQTFQHNINGKKFSGWVRDAGYEYSYTGENLAIDFATNEGIFNAWLNSPDHKKNILEPNFKEIGIAAVSGNFQGTNTMLVVQIFGAPPKETAYLKTNEADRMSFSASQAAPQFYDGYAENLLTHSVASAPINCGNAGIITINDYQNNTKTNNFFEQLNRSLPINNCLFLLIAPTTIIIILYIYSFYFIALNKISHRH